MEFRYDQDSLGKVKVPIDAYYGPFTARAICQYAVTGQPAHDTLREAFVMIKRAAAEANAKIGVLDHRRADSIIKACDAILDGKHTQWFVVDMINSGAGTAFNMNVNEVIANVALDMLGEPLGSYDLLHPNDHVNMSQSSNDTYPTSMHLSILFNVQPVIQGVSSLVKSLNSKADEFASYKKIGRTHLMDALPVTLGSEFAAYAVSVERAGILLQEARDRLYPVALGGTAVGSGANAPPKYRETVIKRLAAVSGLPVIAESNMQHALQSRQAVAAVSAALRGVAVEIAKVSNDIRLMASGPMAGLSEITIPAVHAGSSIMPGKVNPSLAECMNMICYNVIGNDTAVTMAAQGGQFELNVMLPGMLKCMLDSTDMLGNFLPVFVSNMVDGLGANADRLKEDIARSPVMVTMLAPKIGYQRAADLFKESLATGKSVRDLAVSAGIVSADEADALLT